ncbi:hypothetical protein BJY14_003887 [Actinomadura luteofluorescens]|uniref:Uncharacterized protein n=1 Tax=Actinomadura luteofluorescens TaxID=46163 RepID=A0A7Y9JHZ7_9ACTN|nr:hypothetical protein [Actinomadura luteofluorescens]
MLGDDTGSHGARPPAETKRSLVIMKRQADTM